MLKKVALAVAAALAAQAASAASIDFHGYMRAQVGGTSEGGNLQCFHMGYPAGSKFRLGNECDNYMEAAFDTKLYKGADGVWANHHLRLGLRDKGANNFEAGDANFEISSRENWVEAGGFFGGPVLQNAKIWVGKRFYNRHDVHINDFYYWANTNPGAGIENIEFGPVKFAYAYTQSGGNSGQNNATAQPIFAGQTGTNGVKVHEFRLYDIPVNPNGKLETALEVIAGSKADLKDTTTTDESADEEVGYRVYLQHVQSNLLGGYNKLALIYGDGNGAGLGWQPDYACGNCKDGKSYQVIEQFMFSPSGTNLSGMATVQYHNNENAAGANDEYYGFGVRPQYNFTENFSAAVEASYELADKGAADKAELVKLTGALQLGAGKGFWARPVFRLFGTYANWNDEAGGQLNGATNNVFESGSNGGDGFTYGAQVEAWW